MAEQAERSSSTFVIPQPLFRRIVGQGAIAMFLIAFIFGVVVSFRNVAGLSIVLISAAGIALFWWLAMPPEHASPRLEITPQAIRYRPGRFERFMAESEFVLGLNAQTQDILLCRSLWQGIPDGFRIIVRAKDGTEHEHRADALDYLNASESTQLAAVLNMVTGLPVRVVKRRRFKDGTIQDSPWPTSRPRGALRLALVFAVAFLPFAAGVIVGYIFPAMTIVLGVGFGLCLIQIAFSISKKRSIAQIAAGAATTLVISGAAYALAYVLTAHATGHY